MHNKCLALFLALILIVSLFPIAAFASGSEEALKELPDGPEITAAPETTEEPFVTSEPQTTEEPLVTEEPQATEEPLATEEPEIEAVSAETYTVNIELAFYDESELKSADVGELTVSFAGSDDSLYTAVLADENGRKATTELPADDYTVSISGGNVADYSAEFTGTGSFSVSAESGNLLQLGAKYVSTNNTVTVVVEFTGDAADDSSLIPDGLFASVEGVSEVKRLEELNSGNSYTAVFTAVHAGEVLVGAETFLESEESRQLSAKITMPDGEIITVGANNTVSALSKLAVGGNNDYVINIDIEIVQRRYIEVVSRYTEDSECKDYALKFAFRYNDGTVVYREFDSGNNWTSTIEYRDEWTSVQLIETTTNNKDDNHYNHYEYEHTISLSATDAMVEQDEASLSPDVTKLYIYNEYRLISHSVRGPVPYVEIRFYENSELGWEDFPNGIDLKVDGRIYNFTEGERREIYLEWYEMYPFEIIGGNVDGYTYTAKCDNRENYLSIYEYLFGGQITQHDALVYLCYTKTVEQDSRLMVMHDFVGSEYAATPDIAVCIKNAQGDVVAESLMTQDNRWTVGFDLPDGEYTVCREFLDKNVYAISWPEDEIISLAEGEEKTVFAECDLREKAAIRIEKNFSEESAIDRDSYIGSVIVELSHEDGIATRQYELSRENGWTVEDILPKGKYSISENSAELEGYLLETAFYTAPLIGTRAARADLGWSNADLLDLKADTVLGVTNTYTEKFVIPEQIVFPLKKVDAASGKGVAGAEFTVFTDAGCTEVYDTAVSDNDGLLSFNFSEENTYYLAETKAPEFFELSDEIIEFRTAYVWEDCEHIMPDGTVVPVKRKVLKLVSEDISPNEDGVYIIANSRYTVSVDLELVIAPESEIPDENIGDLLGVLCDEDGNRFEAVLSRENGRRASIEIPAGHYFVSAEETETIDGYKFSYATGWHEVDIDADFDEVYGLLPFEGGFISDENSITINLSFTGDALTDTELIPSTVVAGVVSEIDYYCFKQFENGWTVTIDNVYGVMPLIVFVQSQPMYGCAQVNAKITHPDGTVEDLEYSDTAVIAETMVVLTGNQHYILDVEIELQKLPGKVDYICTFAEDSDLKAEDFPDGLNYNFRDMMVVHFGEENDWSECVPASEMLVSSTIEPHRTMLMNGYAYTIELLDENGNELTEEYLSGCLQGKECTVYIRNRYKKLTSNVDVSLSFSEDSELDATDFPEGLELRFGTIYDGYGNKEHMTYSIVLNADNNWTGRLELPTYEYNTLYYDVRIVGGDRDGYIYTCTPDLNSSSIKDYPTRIGMDGNFDVVMNYKTKPGKLVVKHLFDDGKYSIISDHYITVYLKDSSGEVVAEQRLSGADNWTCVFDIPEEGYYSVCEDRTTHHYVVNWSEDYNNIYLEPDKGMELIFTSEIREVQNGGVSKSFEPGSPVNELFFPEGITIVLEEKTLGEVYSACLNQENGWSVWGISLPQGDYVIKEYGADVEGYVRFTSVEVDYPSVPISLADLEGAYTEPEFDIIDPGNLPAAIHVYNDYVPIITIDDELELSLSKTDAATGDTLTGAEFGVYTDEACTQLIARADCDEDGSCSFSFTQPGTYYLKELIAPEYYELTEEPVCVLVDQTWTEESGIGTSGRYIKRTSHLSMSVEGLEMNGEGEYIWPNNRATTELSVEKIFIGNEGELRPQSIEVVLMKDGETLETVTLSAENEWKHTWTGLPEGYEYTVDELTVPDGYAKTVTETDGHFVICNRYIIEEGECTVFFVKRGEDSGAALAGAAYSLYRDEACTELIETAVSGEDGCFSYRFTEPGVYYVKESAAPENYQLSPLVVTIVVTQGWTEEVRTGEDGLEYTARVELLTAEVRGLEAEQSGAYVVTNPRETVSISVEKSFYADDASKRPQSISVTLFCDGEEVETVELSAANGWKHSWDELYKGHEYTVDETVVPVGYSKVIVQDGNKFIISNWGSLVPATGDDKMALPWFAAAILSFYGFVISGCFMPKKKKNN